MSASICPVLLESIMYRSGSIFASEEVPYLHKKIFDALCRDELSLREYNFDIRWRRLL